MSGPLELSADLAGEAYRRAVAEARARELEPAIGRAMANGDDFVLLSVDSRGMPPLTRSARGQLSTDSLAATVPRFEALTAADRQEAERLHRERSSGQRWELLDLRPVSYAHLRQMERAQRDGDEGLLEEIEQEMRSTSEALGMLPAPFRTR